MSDTRYTGVRHPLHRADLLLVEQAESTASVVDERPERRIRCEAGPCPRRRRTDTAARAVAVAPSQFRRRPIGGFERQERCGKALIRSEAVCPHQLELVARVDPQGPVDGFRGPGTDRSTLFGEPRDRIDSAVRHELAIRRPRPDPTEKLARGEPRQPGRALGVGTAMLVVSDGDVIANRIHANKGMYYMLGFDRYANAKIYGNREFIINGMNYLLDDQSLISIRSRAITLRQLDPSRIVDERLTWQLVNTAIPILLSILAGLAYHMVRRRRNRFS